jgi:hypothetical protein
LGHEPIISNARIHTRKLEGKTEQEHTRIIKEVRGMMLVDKADCHLLEQDYLQLGEGTTVDRQYWLTQTNSDLSTVEVEARHH